MDTYITFTSSLNVMFHHQLHVLQIAVEITFQTNVSSCGLSNAGLGKTLVSGHLVALLRARQMCVFPRLLESSVRRLVNQGEIGREALDMLNTSSKIDKVVETIVS